MKDVWVSVLFRSRQAYSERSEAKVYNFINFVTPLGMLSTVSFLVLGIGTMLAEDTLLCVLNCADFIIWRDRLSCSCLLGTIVSALTLRIEFNTSLRPVG